MVQPTVQMDDHTFMWTARKCTKTACQEDHYVMLCLWKMQHFHLIDWFLKILNFRTFTLGHSQMWTPQSIFLLIIH